MVSDRALRVVFFGTPEFAVPTQPDRPRGRGHKTSASPVKTAALKASLPILQPARLKDESFLAALAAWRPDMGVVAAYGRIRSDRLRGPTWS